MTARPTPIREIVVVVPVRDEELTLEACLWALTSAMDSLGASGTTPGPRVTAIIVLDTCRDASALIAGRASARDPRIRVVECLRGSVGAARRAGVRAALTPDAPSVAPEAGVTWIASTDADSMVPADWLVTHLQIADDGADILLGTVSLAAAPDDAELGARWRSSYADDEGRPHIHGANLGVRASTYLLAGGFPPVREHEDVELVAAAEAAGAVIVASERMPVVTSARRIGRTPGGFASFLSDLCDPAQRPRENQHTTTERSMR